MQRAAKSTDTRIVDQDVESTEGRLNMPGGVLDRLKIGHITNHYVGLSARFHNSLRRGLERGSSATAKHCGDSQIRQLVSDGGANAPPSAGDDCYLPREREICVHHKNASIRKSIPAPEVCFPRPDEGHLRKRTIASYTIKYACKREVAC